jgi:hypothetical protein
LGYRNFGRDSRCVLAHLRHGPFVLSPAHRHFRRY